MGNYVDPDESDPSKWRGSAGDGGTGDDDLRSVVERAVATEPPYRRREAKLYGPDDVREAFDTRDYHHAKVYFDGGVTAAGGVKLLTRGYLWGDDERHQRYKSQYRREPDPTDHPPFGVYTVWNQYQFGTARRDGDGALQFEPDTDESGEYLRAVDWSALYTPVKVRLAELELVRNPAFARYRLEELGRWADYGASLRYDPDAFAVGP